MSGHNQDTLNALQKEVYPNGIMNVVPDGVKLYPEYNLAEAERVGDKFVQPVQLSDEAGFTYAGSNSDEATMEASIPAEFREAHVDGMLLALRTSIRYGTAGKMIEKGKASFAKWSQLLYTGMINAHGKRREIEWLHGRDGLGKVDTFTVGSPTTTGDLVITVPTWAAGIWAGSRKATIDIYNGSTKINTNAAITITSVVSGSRTLKVSGNATDLAAIAAGYDIYYRGAYGKEAYGLHAMLKFNGTIFNIDNGIYDLWKGQEHSAASAALSMVKVFAGIAKAVDFGLEKDVVLIVNPNTYKDLNSDLAALRMLDSSYKPAENENGSKNIKYYSQNGSIEVMPHIFQKQGQACAFAKEYLKKIGSHDLEFAMPGAKEASDIFLHVQDKLSYEVRCISSVSPFLEYLARGVHFSDITNT